MLNAIDRRDFLKKSALTGGVLLGLSAGELAGMVPADATTQIKWGALCLPGDGQSTQEAAVAALEKKVGRKFATTHYRMPWDVSLTNRFTNWSHNTGHRKQILSWFARTKKGLISWKGIAAGNWDGWITTQARSLKNSNFSGFFCFHKEPENEGNATDWKAAYNRVHKIFNNVGVPNFKWVVGLCASTYEKGQAGLWLPNQWDILGVDGYNRNYCGASNGWRSFTQIFQPSVTFAKNKRKPLYIIESGCVEGPTGAKGKWIANAAAQIKNWPQIMGFSYNHEHTDCTYWVDSTTSALNSFKTMGSQTYYHG